ncbi:MAG: glycosyltransferase family 4 protein [Mycobacteriaceae bacterium]
MTGGAWSQWDGSVGAPTSTTRDRAPRLSMVTQWFKPEPVGAPVWISTGLKRVGWSVVVLTGIPNFPTGNVFVGYSPWRRVSERIGGLNVYRTPLFPSHDRSALRRMMNYLSWGISASMLGFPVLGTCDVSLVYGSPATAALPALVAKVLRGSPYVLMVQDVWPDSVFASGFLTAGLRRRIMAALVETFVNATYRHATHVAVISPGMKTLLEDRGVPSEKVSLVYNWVDEDIFADKSPDNSWRTELGLAHDDFVVMYAGTHGFAQDLATAVDAFGLLPASTRAHLVLMGDGVEKPGLVERARRVAPDRVHFLPARPTEVMGATMAAADVLLVSLRDDPLFRITLPSKVQASLAVGRPVLVSAPGDAARVVEQAGAGLAVSPGDPDELARAVLALEAMDPILLRKLGSNGRHFYRAEMAEAIGVARLSQLLTAAMRTGR